MIYGIYKNRICGFDVDGRFIANFDEVPTDSIVYAPFSDIKFPSDCVAFEYLYWSIERTHYRNLERSVMRNIYSEHAFTRQFRTFLERWGKCSLEAIYVSEAKEMHDRFYEAQKTLNAYSLNMGGVIYPNKYLFGTVSGRFTNVSGKKNLLALSKQDKSNILSNYGYFVHLDMSSFHFNILRNEYNIDVPPSPYDWISEKLGVSRKDAKLSCLRWMNTEERSNNVPQFIRSIWNLRERLGMTAKEFNYEIQMKENILMCGTINKLSMLLKKLGLKFSICNYCYDSITIDCDYKASKVLTSLFSDSKYYSKVLGSYPFTFEVKKGIF